MKQFAFVNKENIVGAVIVSKSMETLSEIPGGSEGIELPDGHCIGAGHIYNPTDNTFTEPEPEVTND